MGGMNTSKPNYIPQKYKICLDPFLYLTSLHLRTQDYPKNPIYIMDFFSCAVSRNIKELLKCVGLPYHSPHKFRYGILTMAQPMLEPLRISKQ
jgi:hypothetical protein